jgi:hypothetical protein
LPGTVALAEVCGMEGEAFLLVDASGAREGEEQVFDLVRVRESFVLYVGWPSHRSANGAGCCGRYRNFRYS